MARFIVRAIFAAFGLWLSAQLLDGVAYAGLVSLIAAAVLLGIVNAVVRPVVFVLTLPLTIVTLGLFLLVVNAAMIGLVAMFLPVSPWRAWDRESRRRSSPAWSAGSAAS